MTQRDRRARWWCRALLAAVVLTGACASEELAVELGTGVSTFEALADGDRVPIVRGFQGAQHIWAQARVSLAGEARVELRFSLEEVGSGEELHHNRFALTLVPWESLEADTGVVSGFGRPGTYAFVPDPTLIAEREIMIRVRVSHPDGRTGMDARRVIPEDRTGR